MSETVFLAGATGAIGAALVPLLVEAGYTVYGTTRRPERAAVIEAMGARPVVVDVFDRDTLTAAVARVEPTVVVHQLTDLPPGLDPQYMADAIGRNARVREEGTANLVHAALAAGCLHIVAQSIAWAYADGEKPYLETQPLDLAADGSRGITVRGVAALERAVLGVGQDDHQAAGAVLRYGNLYGPRTGRLERAGASPVHVEAAAWATLLAVQLRATGVFNIAEDQAEVSSEKAKRELEWHPGMRLLLAQVQS
ncbi:NAD-dependent epimerase/dehydratase family protein [Trinickia fusca]|uniref:NAD(P)-dependent oxidoreductase n=1 Tax=Trinickia fusca TaxID=2419777 RepID=A0A494X5K1_9BURK|nr:NAD(P)-dependent oxidoreductase [Trinickia fusca]RKP43516.1 NAD(P)-dependent oxidoreductase [Trinickia fusca]